ncbi:mRNA 3'-end-processing protein rna14 [Microbotryomycetes sp. JL201]|nr:mRNA 3'-end-processing protein rna14 [Microbotryomycetes sp. JL201]
MSESDTVAAPPVVPKQTDAPAELPADAVKTAVAAPVPGNGVIASVVTSSEPSDVTDSEVQQAAQDMAISALDASIAATLADAELSAAGDNSHVASGDVNASLIASPETVAPSISSEKPDAAVDANQPLKLGASDPTLAQEPSTGLDAPPAPDRAASQQPLGFLASNPGTPLHDAADSETKTGTIASLPSFKPRLPGALSKVAQLTARIERDPLDAEAQLALIRDAERKGDLERTREVYENFFKYFPDAAKQWIAYADLELSHGFFDRVQEIFLRCLRPSTSVALWKFYLDFVRRRNPVDVAQTEQSKAARATITKAFEFAINHIGQDRKAGEIWYEYLAFLKEGGNRGTWEDQQKMDALRKAYQRAVQVPLDNVEQIWQDYNQFENTMSKMTAKKFVAELSPAYMTARKVLRELRARFDDLPEPNLPQRPDWSKQDKRALDMWRQYLAYEETNPLDIEEPTVLQGRIGFAYKKAIASMRFFSEIWYRAAQYDIKLGKEDEARIVLNTGKLANPSSLLLAYTLAELEEAKGDFDECHKIYSTLIEHFHGALNKEQQALQEEVQEALEQFDSSPDIVADGQDEDVKSKTVQDREELKASITARKEAELNKIKKAAASVWITEMTFARRAEGVKQARLVFTRARKSPTLIWQVIDASASMEYHWNSDPKVATNVYELGLKTFSKDPDYVLQYLDFLMLTNNPNNARALFERTVALVEPEKAKKVWERMVDYECRFGDFTASRKILQRYHEAFPGASPIERFVHRYGGNGLDEGLADDLGFVRRHGDLGGAAFSPKRGGGKRAAAPVNQDEPKRFKPNPIEHSPAPSSTGGGEGPGAWGRGRGGRLVPEEDEDDMSGGDRGPRGQRGGRRRGPSALNVDDDGHSGLQRAAPYVLDAAGRTSAVLPDAVVFFLSLLPPASSFTGPMLNPATLVDIIGSTLLPGTAPGGALPGERLGIPPPRKGAKDERNGYDRSPRAGFSGGGGGGGDDFGGRRRRRY